MLSREVLNITDQHIRGLDNALYKFTLHALSYLTMHQTIRLMDN